ncbi:hypothetical protein ACXZ66_06580 [Corynebacterium sp. S7]
MNYNPYTVKVVNLKHDIADFTSALNRLESDLSWFKAFNAQTAEENLESENQNLKAGENESKEIKTKIRSLEKKIKKSEEELKPGWKLWNLLPTTERKRAKTALEQRHKQLARLNSQLNTSNTKNNATKSKIAEIKNEIDRFNALDEDFIKSEISDLRHKIEVGQKEFSDLKDKEASINQLIEKQVAKLESIAQRIRGLNTELSKARTFEERLNSATNGYERRLIHEECEAAFGSGSPSKEIRRIMKQIESEERNQRKIENRIQDIIEREGQDIQSVVIDGSNLCYDGDEFIGLSALRQLCEEIPEDIHVEVIFDGSILKTLGLRDERVLHDLLPGTKFHLDDNPSGADEMILDAASASTAYVISGDRFADFADKPVVKEDRVLRARFINGTVQIRRMDIRFEYSK